MIVDTSLLLAFYNTDEPAHAPATRLLTTTSEPMIVSPYVVAELDYLMATRYGVESELRVLTDLCRGTFDHASIEANDLSRVVDVVRRYADQDIGVTDASIVVLADRYQSRTIATLDRRHFDVLRPMSGGRFRVLP